MDGAHVWLIFQSNLWSMICQLIWLMLPLRWLWISLSFLCSVLMHESTEVLIFCYGFIFGIVSFTILLFQRVLPTDAQVILQREESDPDWHMPKASSALWDRQLASTFSTALTLYPPLLSLSLPSWSHISTCLSHLMSSFAGMLPFYGLAF